MKRTSTALLLSLAFLLLNGAVHAQLSSGELDSLMQNALGKFNVAGAAIAIVKDGKIIHEKGFGVRSIQTKLPVD
ncbi:MAG: hypothetical protein ABIT58_10245, partial [Ferruginibacter sp.]